MSLLRRLVGSRGGQSRGGPADTRADPPEEPADDAERERELALEDAARLAGDLVARQVRWADRSWTPPPQGGPLRADGPRADDAP